MHMVSLSASLLALMAAPVMGAGSSYRCENIRIGGHSFDLKKLGGPHSVVTTRYESIPDTHFNTTYTVDVCAPLKKSGGKNSEECPMGTRVCAITHYLKEKTDSIWDIIAIAGHLENHSGSQFEYEATRLKTSESNADSEKEGLRLVLKGGKHPLKGPSKERRPQKAVIEFLCDPEKTGLEGEWKAEDRYDGDDGSKSSRRDDDKEGDNDGDDDEEGGESAVEHQLKKDDAALVWERYGAEDDSDVLRMTWWTKHACESRDESGDDEDDEDNGTHWGFFTWFIIIAFLGIAAYLIFGSWLNYNRYGARGWDLVPHSDTIRDVPYLVKDWVRRVLNTVQGAGSRGGYSSI